MQNITGLSFVNNGTLSGYSFYIAEQMAGSAANNRTAFVIPEDH